MAGRKSSAKKKNWGARVIITLILCAALCLSLVWASQINDLLGLTIIKERGYGGTSRSVAVADASAEVLGLGDNLNVHFIDVGQGDACVIELPDDKKVLIDGGTNSAEDSLLTYIDQNIKTENGEAIKFFDYAILTHSDEDHSGGIDKVLEKYPAQVFYRPNILCEYSGGDFVDPARNQIKSAGKVKNHDTKTYSRALTEGYNADETAGVKTQVIITDASSEDSKIAHPDKADEEYYEINFYAPTEKYYSDVNDYSPIIILEYHGKRVALSGDAEKKSEELFVAKAKTKNGKYKIFDENFTVSAIKLGHHGSSTSSSREYLETLTTPQSVKEVIIIISCGMDNKYKHPSKETLDRQKEMGFKDENIISTAVNSTIGMSVKAQKVEETPTYQLFVGADVIRQKGAAIGNENIKLQWTEIVILAVTVLVLAIIVVPMLKSAKQARKKSRKNK